MMVRIMAVIVVLAGLYNLSIAHLAYLKGEYDWQTDGMLVLSGIAAMGIGLMMLFMPLP